MDLTTTQFGKIQIEDDNILEFKEGLIGFEEYKRFIIVSDKDLYPIFWLVSIDEPSLEFPIINPFLFIPDYNPDIELEEGSETIFTILTLKKEVDKTTVNLKGPLVININQKKGRQIILSDDKYSLNHPLLISNKE